MKSIKKLDREDMYLSCIAVLLFILSIGGVIWVVKEVVALSGYLPPETIITTLLSNPLFVTVTLLASIGVFIILDNYVGGIIECSRGVQ